MFYFNLCAIQKIELYILFLAKKSNNKRNNRYKRYKSFDPESRALVIREAMHCPAGRLVIHDRKTRQVIEDPLEPAIGIVEDPTLGCSGLLWIQGGITIESEDGHRYETRNRVTLCRCGASDNMPFCNGSHASVKFKDSIL